jgi:hypothetical protein
MPDALPWQAEAISLDSRGNDRDCFVACLRIKAANDRFAIENDTRSRTCHPEERQH